jgi:tetratricopeptide (TPR) repeat protein
LLHERRTFLHARVVAALEDIAGENLRDHIETLAHHAFHGELLQKAVTYSRQAGIKAMARSANNEAVLFLEQALDALSKQPGSRQKLEQGVEIRLELRNALFLLGEFNKLYSHLREAESLAEALDDQQKLGRVLNFLISYFGLVGEHDHAITAGQRALNLNKDSLELNVVTYYYLGQAYHHTGQYDRSIEVLNRTLALVSEGNRRYERFGTASIISVISRVWMVQCLAQLGDFSQGLAHAQEAMRIAEEVNHPYSLAYANCSLGILLLLKGDLDWAITVLERSQRICELSAIKVLLTHVDSHLGCAYALSGRLAEAMPLFEQSEQQSILIGRKAGQALRLTWHGQASLMSGDNKKALQFANRALELALQAKERGYQAWVLKLLGDIAAYGERKETEQPARYYREALSLATDLGMRPLEAHCHLSLGELYAQISQSDKARKELSTAIELYRLMEMTAGLREVEIALAKIAQTVPSTNQAVVTH